MIAILAQLATDHSLATIFAALIICLAAGWLLTSLRDRAAASVGIVRLQWLAGTAFVAGLGVWTTHFMAMIGYRPDLPLGYGAGITTASAVIGVLAVGMPLAATAVVQNAAARASLGAMAGLGIGAMHYTGMLALSGCLQSQHAGATVAAFGAGAVLMAIGCGSSRISSSTGLFCAAFTLSVCGAHFVSISGTTLVPVPDMTGVASDNVTLSIFTAMGAAVLLIGALMITLAARRFDAQADAHTAILATALHNMSNGLVFIEKTGKLGLFNERFVEMFGLSGMGLRLGMTSDEVIDLVSSAAGWNAAQREWAAGRIEERLRATKLAPIDYVLPNGRTVEIDSNSVAGGGTVITYNDVTEERAARAEISELAYHDPLTGLPNRLAFRERKLALMAGDKPFHLLLVDLDRFKAVNDTYGHGVGDELLVQVARRVVAMVGENGFAARLGGDEIGVFVYGSADEASQIAEGVVEAVSKPFNLGELTVSVGCSIGLCSGEGIDSHDVLMQCADVALYDAKHQGKGRIAAYRNGMLEAATERHKLEADLRQAMSLNQFYLAYQPVMELEKDEIVGYEALLRWEHPERGMVPPASFIPLAEETGLIVEIGRWVLEEACREAATWPDERHVAVNVSAVQFRSPLLLSHLTAALAASGLPARRLEVELTETALVEDGPKIASVLADIRHLGVKVAMDDFGTGYSSLAHLCDFPLDRIKIDRSFVVAAENNLRAHGVVMAVVALGRQIGVPTLAEGIETEEQLKLLRGLGCGAVQGFLIGKPARLRRKDFCSQGPRRATA
ncbi:MAG: EAL domain-containing protein [Fulvimarina manganoxydans]|uniref:bifunctional diguanylate cyclase/phosphodiesterase n=1 Tax=Fulvimarina manganoxydans TaxID=937218 RepID=UPI002357868A|nr:EAL domain-containing protein [Fulvimarina manganoxydans]MCK5934527.1 EAL domain-containing protein [Fulvimarina manganoxydans]